MFVKVIYVVLSDYCVFGIKRTV